MIYEPNTRDWQPGDIVIHDVDAKIPEMLMCVVKYRPRKKVYVTVYLHPDYMQSMRGTFENERRFLHDPARFGIDVTAVESESQP